MDHSLDRDRRGAVDHHADADQADLPILTARLPPGALAVLRRHLTDELGAPMCEQVLRAADAEIGQLAGGPALAESTNGQTLSLDEAHAAIANTTGLAWQAWGTGQYLVALDGQVIGNIEGSDTTGAFEARRAGAIGALAHTFDNVAGAAAALRLDYEKTARPT